MAELADAQVSEACDGDIVEVQVLSSAPIEFSSEYGGSVKRIRRFGVFIDVTPVSNTQKKKYLSRIFNARCFRNKRSSLKGEY